MGVGNHHHAKIHFLVLAEIFLLLVDNINKLTAYIACTDNKEVYSLDHLLEEALVYHIDRLVFVTSIDHYRDIAFGSPLSNSLNINPIGTQGTEYLTTKACLVIHIVPDKG